MVLLNSFIKIFLGLISALPSWVIKLLLKSYKNFISPLLPGTCRFYPSCSSYALQAFSKYGFFKGFWLSLKRVLRCHPFNAGGYDPLV